MGAIFYHLAVIPAVSFGLGFLGGIIAGPITVGTPNPLYRAGMPFLLLFIAWCAVCMLNGILDGAPPSESPEQMRRVVLAGASAALSVVLFCVSFNPTVAQRTDLWRVPSFDTTEAGFLALIGGAVAVRLALPRHAPSNLEF